MERDIDYIHWSDELIFRCDFHNAMFESLSPSSEDMFIRRMENAFPGFSKCVVPGVFTGVKSISSIIVMSTILGKYSLDDLKERANAFSYNCELTGNGLVLAFKPTHAPSDLPNENKYIHISPVATLMVDGIRCKASGRVETYEPRIYLRPLPSMVDLALQPDKMYDALIRACSIMASMFNARYIKKGLIKSPEDYYVYLVELPEHYPCYRDTSYDRPSIYVENNIPAKYVTRIGFLPSGESESSMTETSDKETALVKLREICEGTPRAFTESILSGYAAIFESADVEILTNIR